MSQITIKIDPKHPLSAGQSEQQLEAELVGRFLAVHANPTLDVGGYVVTHVPTGLMIENFVTQEYAMWAAVKLAELGDVWDFDSFQSLPEEKRDRLRFERTLVVNALEEGIGTTPPTAPNTP